MPLNVRGKNDPFGNVERSLKKIGNRSARYFVSCENEGKTKRMCEGNRLHAMHPLEKILLVNISENWCTRFFAKSCTGFFATYCICSKLHLQAHQGWFAFGHLLISFPFFDVDVDFLFLFVSRSLSLSLSDESMTLHCIGQGMDSRAPVSRVPWDSELSPVFLLANVKPCF